MIIAFLVIGVNFFFVVMFIQEKIPSFWAAYLGVAVVVILYMEFVFYLVSDCNSARGLVRPLKPLSIK